MIDTVWSKCASADFLSFIKLAIRKPELYRLVKSGKVSCEFLAENAADLKAIEDEMMHIEHREKCAENLKGCLRKGLAEELGHALHRVWLSRNSGKPFEDF